MPLLSNFLFLLCVKFSTFLYPIILIFHMIDMMRPLNLALLHLAILLLYFNILGMFQPMLFPIKSPIIHPILKYCIMVDYLHYYKVFSHRLRFLPIFHPNTLLSHKFLLHLYFFSKIIFLIFLDVPLLMKLLIKNNNPRDLLIKCLCILFYQKFYHFLFT